MTHVIVIGGGPGGTAAATRVTQLGAQATLIEKEYLGGNCMNYNCIPFATMMASVEVLDRIRRAKNLGIKVSEPEIDLAQARARFDGIVEELRMGNGALMASFGVDVIEGTARLAGPGKVVVGDRTIQGDAIILATGARPTNPPLRVDNLLTTRQALALDKPPASLLVWGGEAVEVQFAEYFAILGSKVTLVTGEANVLASEDYEVGQRMQSILSEHGVRVLNNATVKSVSYDGQNAQVVIGQRKGDTSVAVERILWAGYAPAIEGLGLETAGVKVVNGAVQVNAFYQTNVPGIYAIGDLIGKPMYSYAATMHGLVAAEKALGKERRLSLKAMPRGIYTIPEIACVGLSETAAEDQGYEVEVMNVSLGSNVRAMTLDEAAGGIKIVFDRKYGKLLGVHIVGYRANELIAEASLALQNELLAEDFAWAIRGHPTLCESMVEAGRAFSGQALYIPKM
jgi:dihydrolipoamide dehydrogenase